MVRLLHNIPWPKIISMRNRLIHGYDFVDYDIVWDAATISIPELLPELESILPPEEM
jgi:uncharacterized protein with HEPN domain